MRGLTLEQVAELTRLSPRVLAKIEVGDFSALPAGLQGRGHLRAYARAVGVDAEEIIATLGDRLPAEPDALDALRARVRRQFAADHPLTASFQESLESLERRARHVARRSRLGRGSWLHVRRHVAAAVIDAAILAGVSAMMLGPAAWLTGSGLDELWRAARWPLAVSWLLTVALYFTVSQTLGGRSTGTALAVWLARALRQAHAAARWHAS
jgi:transcriptional regulator with XRE-family HTH domain